MKYIDGKIKIIYGNKLQGQQKIEFSDPMDG